MKQVIFFIALVLLFFWNWRAADETGNPWNWVVMGACGIAAFVQVLIMGHLI